VSSEPHLGEPPEQATGSRGLPGRLPDFFIAGHPKCGTTALYLMLAGHPQIFLPAVKEPRYFAFDQRSANVRRQPPGRPRTLEGYAALFADAAPGQLVGDGSPQYLRSRVAAQEIAAVVPGARIIAILREPASFLRSFHMQMVSSGVESERDFARALALEPERRAGRRIPRGCHHPESLMYSEHVRYAEQLGRFYEHFGADRVLVLVYEEFRADNQGTVRGVLRFLGADERQPVVQIDTRPLREVRSGLLHRVTAEMRRARKNPAAAGRLARAADAVLPERLRRPALTAGWRRAVYTQPRPPDPQLMLALRRRFEPEVRAAGELLGRDLVSLWGYEHID
jgi:Sulfotransferase family